MANVKWVKMNVDMFDDEKIKIIQAMPNGDTLLMIWIRLIALAGKTNDGGHIYISEDIPYTDEMLAVVFGKPAAKIRTAVDTFIKLGMLEKNNKGMHLVNFEKHQSLDKMDKIKEQTRQRVANYREKKALQCNADVTQCNATEEEREEEIEKEYITRHDKTMTRQRVCAENFEKKDMPIVDIFCLIIDEALSMADDEVCVIDGKRVQASFVKDIFSKVDFFCLEFALSKCRTVGAVTKTKPYLRTVLYNAFFEMNPAYELEARRLIV